jgi:hypothetical protein
MARFPSWKRAGLRHHRLLPVVPLLVAITTGVFVGAMVGLVDSQPDEPPAGRPLPPSALAPEDASAAPTPQRRRGWVNVVDAHAPPPRKIVIAAIGVSAKVIPLGLNRDHTMQTPENFANAGWYKPGPEPGERGTAVVVGHVDSKRGPAVFYRLRQLRRGNIIKIVRAGGSAVRFRVEGLERWPKARFPTRKVFRPARLSALRLVTCSGAFDTSSGHYVDNTIVYAVRVRVRRPARG